MSDESGYEWQPSPLLILLLLVLETLVLSYRAYTIEHRLVWHRWLIHSARDVQTFVIVASVIITLILVGTVLALPLAERPLAQYASIAGVLIPLVFTPYVADLTGTSIAASFPACKNAQIQGAQYLATTPDNYHLQSYAGPERDYSAIRSYSPSCTIGLDYYCIGEFLPSAGASYSGLLDSRWFKVTGLNGFVPGTYLIPTSPSSTPRYGGNQCSGPGALGSSEPDAPQLCPDTKLDRFVSTVPRSTVAVRYHACRTLENMNKNTNLLQSISLNFFRARSDRVPADVGLALIKDSQVDSRMKDVLNLGVVSGYVQPVGPYKPITQDYLSVNSQREPFVYVLAMSCVAPGVPAQPDSTLTPRLNPYLVIRVNTQTLEVTALTGRSLTSLFPSPDDGSSSVVTRAEVRACLPDA